MIPNSEILFPIFESLFKWKSTLALFIITIGNDYFQMALRQLESCLLLNIAGAFIISNSHVLDVFSTMV